MFDLDGTLSNCTARVHLIREVSWDAFHAQCALDPVYPAEAEVARAWGRFHNVAYVTGRSEPHRDATERWLSRNDLPKGLLLMRAANDVRPSTEAKFDLMKELQRRIHPRQSIAFVMEDQDKLVALWRDLGMTCLQPRAGAF